MIDKAQFIAESSWRYFWHPVCTLKELRKNPDGRGKRMRVRLLAQNLIVAETNSGVIALGDKCAHRSSSLSLGWVEGDCVRCPYHGWVYNSEGVCIEIPAAPGMPIPPAAKVARYDAKEAYGLVWVRLDSALDIPVPPCPDWDDPEMKCVPFEPYLWKTSAARRLENFVDLSHFPFVHEVSLGSREHTTFPVPTVNQTKGQIRFTYIPLKGARKTGDTENKDVEVVRTDYRIIMPFGVHVVLHARNGRRTGLWMVASPMESGMCRIFQMGNRTHFFDPDQIHLDFQWRIVLEDVPIIESQEPPEIPDPQSEISTPPDKVSIHYRRWLHQMSRAAEKGPDALANCLWAERLEGKETPAAASA